MENCVYIISGPPGVGKSTVSKELAYSFNKSAVIEGGYDLLNDKKWSRSSLER